MTRGNIYFDFNATTPADGEVLKQVPQWLALWGNPSSIHAHGRGPKKLLRESRRSIAKSLQCHPLEIVFTSGGSESNNMALKGLLTALKKKDSKRHRVLLGGIEHPSVLKQIPDLQAMGFTVERIPVNKNGQYDLKFYQEKLDDQVALVSVMLANNELGTIAPLQTMISQAKEVGAFFHSDMVQALGKYPFSLQALPVDLASFSSHKVYALKGSGLLFIRKGTPFESLTQGGAQERGRRAGTENTVAIASFAHRIAVLDSASFAAEVAPLRDFFESSIAKEIPGVEILGQASPRLANTSCFTIVDVSGESLLMNLDIRGFSVGTGAACSSGNPEPSPVLLAIGLSRDQAQSSLRISLGKDTTKAEVESLARALAEVVVHLRKLQTEHEVLHG